MPLPNPKRQTRHLFNRLAPHYARRVLLRSRSEVRQDVDWLRPQSHERVLDLACGPATVGLGLARQVRSVFACDLSENMLAEARLAIRTRHRTNIHLCLADAERLPLPPHSFDLVVCRCSFANFPAPQHVVSEMQRVTRPGGRMGVVEIVAPDDPVQCRRLNQLERLRSHAPTRILSLADLLALFYHANLHLLDCLVLRRRQPLQDWLALSANGQERRQRARLKERVLRLAEDMECQWLLSREGGRWHLHHTVARLLWRK